MYVAPCCLCDVICCFDVPVRCSPVAAVLVVIGGKHINRFAAMNWRRFATQNYFDQNGAFFTILVSAPLLVTAFFILVRTSIVV